MEPENWIIDRIKNLTKRDIFIIATIFSIALIAVLLFFVFPGSETATADPVDNCLDCHDDSLMPGIYSDWSSSVHAAENVTCIDCHLADASDPDAEINHEGSGNNISVVVSPLDCAECHEQQVQEFDQSLHSFGALYYEDLFKKGKLNFLESQIEGGYIIRQDEELIHAATMRGCQSCHGTNMTGKSINDFDVWPNNGIGRINPDGSRGSCSACHSRHSFSIAEARHPETCGQCHMGPDHPQIEMYLESKHGNIYSSEGDSWNWTKKNWTAGVDYRAPTCAGCHMSGIPGNPDVPTTHDVSARLSWELESEVSKRTDNTANALGFPISDGSTWQTKQGRMKAVCNQCHSTTWTNNYYEQADVAVELHDKQYAEAKEIVVELYNEGLLTTTAFDEPIEFKIYEMWHHEGRRARMGAFMMAPDYVQWHGFYDLFQDKVEIEHMAAEIREAAMEPEEEPILVFFARDGPGTTVFLKWEITNSSDVDHYELYWGTELLTDYSQVTPNANTQDDTHSVSGLVVNTTYYFTIVAVDLDGNETAVAFSSAMPPKAEKVDPADKDEDTDSIDPILPLLLAIVALLVGLIGILMAMKKGGEASSSSEIKKDDIPMESPEDETP
jgi:hypothetical protein